MHFDPLTVGFLLFVLISLFVHAHKMVALFKAVDVMRGRLKYSREDAEKMLRLIGRERPKAETQERRLLLANLQQKLRDHLEIIGNDGHHWRIDLMVGGLALEVLFNLFSSVVTILLSAELLGVWELNVYLLRILLGTQLLMGLVLPPFTKRIVKSAQTFANAQDFKLMAVEDGIHGRLSPIMTKVLVEQERSRPRNQRVRG